MRSVISSEQEGGKVMANERGEPALDLTGGTLCIDFANTLDERGTGQPIEQAIARFLA